MNKLIYLLVFLSSSLIFPSCFKQKNQNTKTVDSFQLVFADQALAKNLIVQDKVEGFFEKIEALDVAIQLKKTTDQFTSQNYVETYKQFLQDHVLEFDADEKQLLQSVFENIKEKLGRINIDLGLDKIILIKTDGAGYGNDAFYTRENTIVIPKGQLSNNKNGLNAVMLHELFHIFSRYNTDHKTEIYKLIGFQPMDNVPIINDPVLKSRLLLNPDGLATNSYIRLTNKNGEQIKAVPLIYSTYGEYKSDVEEFFTYLKFDLYRLEEKDGKKIVLSNGVSTDVDKEYFSSFFKTIADNTQYIIHPDEIMADNFMLMVDAYAKNDLSTFSKDGKELIEKLHAYLSEK